MKKFLLLGAVACVAIYSCKKDGTTTTITNTVHDTTITTSNATGIVNADTLTAGMKVAYGTNIAGAFPTASADAAAPVLDSFYFKTYTVVRSRYLTIYPPDVSGHIAGYYIQIAGAGSYFKVDYSQAYGLRKAKQQGTAGFRSDIDGSVDSTIVIKLPASIKGDTFYVRYASYDSSNLVSNAVTALVTVLPEANDALADSLSGKWSYEGDRYYTDGQYNADTFNINHISYDSYQYFNCVNDKLTQAGNPSEYNLALYKYNYSEILTFAKHDWTDGYFEDISVLDTLTSSCSNNIYQADTTISNYNGGGSLAFDSRSRKLTLIYDYNSNVSLSYSTFTLTELTDKYMILGSEYNTDDNYGMRFIKLVKQ